MIKIIEIDASTFQHPLNLLAETMINKTEREANEQRPIPQYTAIDIAVLLRMSRETFDLIFYMNADETVSSTKPIFPIVIAPLVRNMIDHFYNITRILKDPTKFGKQFRLSGLMKDQRMIADEEKKYAGQPEWDVWVRESREKIDLQMRTLGITQTEIDATDEWPTLGKYIGTKGKGGSLDAHQAFLEGFLYGRWRHYSALAHGGPEGLRAVAMYFNLDRQPFEDRPLIKDGLLRMRSYYALHCSLILLATITELQAYFQFSGANINKRIKQVWDALMVHMDTRELYASRYEHLMKDKKMI